MSSRSSIISLILSVIYLITPAQEFQSECYAQCSTCTALRFVGDAFDSAGVITLTPSARASRGAIWTIRRHAIADGFTASFSYRILDTGGHEDPSGRAGGDGFAFVIQDDNAAAIGGAGYALGYGWTVSNPGISNSLAVEFDFWDDTGLPEAPDFVDFASYHVAIHSAGKGENRATHDASLAVNADVPRTDDGQWHRTVIQYEPGGPDGMLLDVSIDSIHILSWSGLLDTLLGLDSGLAWIGITASTMSAWQRQQVSDLVIAPLGDDTVRWNRCRTDTVLIDIPVHDTVMVVRIDTVRMIDTLRTFVSGPPRLFIVHDTVRSMDSVVVIQTDSLLIVLSDTLRSFDTCYILRDVCHSVLDTICGGQLRQMTAQTRVQGIRSIDPNPSTGITTIHYTLGDPGRYILSIYDIQGREVWNLAGVAAEGEYEAMLDAGSWPRGFYIVRLRGRAGSQSAVLSVGE